jgi:hypothetical protein
MASATKSIQLFRFSQRIPALSKPTQSQLSPVRGARCVAAGLLLGFASALFLCNVHAARPMMMADIEFYGDSITSGIRVNCGRTDPECNDQNKAFSALIGGRILGVPGQGVIHPGGFHGERPNAEEYFFQNYSKDHEPRFVVIEEATNDNSTSRIPRFWGIRFYPAYWSYLHEIRSVYPDSTILCLAPFNGRHASDIQGVVRFVDDSRIRFVDTSGWIAEPDTTDGLHPNAEGHKKIAARLSRLLEVPETPCSKV